MCTLLAELTGQPSPLNWLVKHTAYPSLVIGLVRKNRGVQHAVKGAHWTSKSLEAFRVIVDMHIHKKVGGKTVLRGLDYNSYNGIKKDW